MGLEFLKQELICTLLGLWAISAIGQPSISGKFISRAWTTANGLPHDSVTSVLQTHDEFLWVGTRAGLARFDGVTFQKAVFPGTTNSDLWITDLCEDPAGHLFIGTDRDGLFCYASNHVARFGLEKDSITSLSAGPEGELWIGTRNGLTQWNGQRFRRFTQAEGLPEETVVSVSAARSGKVWITLRSGVYLLADDRFEKYHLSPESQSRTPEFLGVYEDPQHELWAFGDTYLLKLREGRRFNYFRSGHLPSIRIWSFHEGRDGRMWIGTSGQGFFQFTDERFRPVEMESGKRPSDVHSICEDLHGNLWLGTDGGGLMQLREDPLRHLGAAEGLPASSALCLAEYLTNNVLIAYADGSLFSGSRDHFEPYRLLDPTDTQPFARSLCTTPNGDVWLASSGFGMSCLHEHRRIGFSSANGLSGDFVTYTYASPSGIVWAGTRSGDVYEYNGDNCELKGTLDGDVTAMLAPATGDVWIGTGKGAVWRWQSSGLAPVLQANPGTEGYISSLVLDGAGRLWAATRGAGLRCYDPACGKSWAPVNPLPSQYVCGLVFDTQSNLWITTPKGILVARRTEIAEAMNANKNLSLQWAAHLDETGPGLPGGPTSLLSHDGLLWIVAGGSAMLLDPRTALVLHPPPPVYIESIRVNNGSWHSPPAPGPDVAQIHPLVRALEFEFTSPCLTLPERAQFRYKLEGFDPDWVEITSLPRRARYGAIPPGKYRFRLEACDADGTWNREGASFAFLVPIPVWRTSWAICAYVVFTAGMLYSMARFVSHRRLRRRLLALEHSEEMSRERMRIAQDMHDEIGSKLARISYLSEGVKTELKGVYPNARIVDSLAKTSRDLLRSLDQMVWAVNPHNDTVEQLAVYLCRYATDFFQDTSILCEFRVPENLPTTPLSAEVRHNVFLAFQETLTNTLKHSGADHLLVELSTRDHRVQITISDNGRGFDPAKTPADYDRNARAGQGIPGLYRRLQSLGGECRIQSVPGQGTTVLFGIPFGNHRSTL